MTDLVFQRGTTDQIQAYTGPAGTLVIDTQVKRLYVHDGETQGGFPVDSAEALQAIVDRIDGLVPGSVPGLAAALAAGISLQTLNQPDGIVGLDVNGKVEAFILPEFVIDVVEVATFQDLPNPGAGSRVYITLGDNKLWRWSGSAYFEITATPISTDALAEGEDNLYFQDVRVHNALTAEGDVTFDEGTFDLVVPEVTATTLGLEQVQNFGFASAPQAEAMTSNVLYLSPQRLRDIFLKAGLIYVGGEWIMDEGIIGFPNAMVALGSVASDWQGEESIPYPIFFYGTTAQNDALTLEKGQMSVDTDKDLLRIHDGATQGGFELPAA